MSWFNKRPRAEMPLKQKGNNMSPETETTRSKTPEQLKNNVRKVIRSLGGVDSLTFTRQSEFTIALARLRDGSMAVGVTLCSRGDDYDDRMGKLLAASRLQRVSAEELTLLSY